VTAANLGAARDLLDQCLDANAAALREQLQPRIERAWCDAIESIRADLREWLRRASEDASGYVPWRFELAFGLSERHGRDEGSVATPVALDCGIRLRGSIDLVERRADGRLRATDHKTGRARMPSRGVIAGGAGLQPVLYALALEKLYPEGAVDGGRLYYCTSVGGFEEREIALDDAARHAAADVGRIIGEALATPFLPASPARGACEWCDYRVVCGPYEEIRTARKPRDAVARLQYLRSVP
jgi:CRISPR/Cas system-associated exonuclease Cas4 (RecB family)